MPNLIPDSIRTQTADSQVPNSKLHKVVIIISHCSGKWQIPVLLQNWLQKIFCRSLLWNCLSYAFLVAAAPFWNSLP